MSDSKFFMDIFGRGNQGLAVGQRCATVDKLLSQPLPPSLGILRLIYLLVDGTIGQAIEPDQLNLLARCADNLCETLARTSSILIFKIVADTIIVLLRLNVSIIRHYQSYACNADSPTGSNFSPTHDRVPSCNSDNALFAFCPSTFFQACRSYLQSPHNHYPSPPFNSPPRSTVSSRHPHITPQQPSPKSLHARHTKHVTPTPLSGKPMATMRCPARRRSCDFTRTNLYTPL